MEFEKLVTEDKEIIFDIMDKYAKNKIRLDDALATALTGFNNRPIQKTPEQKLEDAMQAIRDFSNDPLKIAALQGLINEFFDKIDFNHLNDGRKPYEEKLPTAEEIIQNKQQDLEFKREDYQRDLFKVIIEMIGAGRYSGGKNQIVDEAATLLEYIKQKSLQVVV